MDEHGRHIAATLKRLGESSNDMGSIEVEAANRLRRLVPDIDRQRIRDDEKREQIVVELKFRGSGFWLSPRAMSDGTLRFLALVAMQMDARSSRVLCLEEPENGIHPGQVPELIDLLRDYAVDPDFAAEPDDNPAKQVVINSHSPEVVKQLMPEEVLFVDTTLSGTNREADVRPVDCDKNWRGSDRSISMAHLESWLGGAPRHQRALFQ